MSDEEESKKEDNSNMEEGREDCDIRIGDVDVDAEDNIMMESDEKMSDSDESGTPKLCGMKRTFGMTLQ